MAACLFFSGAGMVQLHAQGSAGISGNVVDQAGKAIESATVLARNSAENKTTQTDSSGHFSLPDLAPGIYTVETSAPGFARSIRVDVQVPSAQDLSINPFCRLDLTIRDRE